MNYKKTTVGRIKRLQQRLPASTNSYQSLFITLVRATFYIALPTSYSIYQAFQPVFSSQASSNLVTDYGPLIATRGILGYYLQTELGHGTNVSALETTATFIPESQEFEIHSPTLTSSKWWIGASGKTSTHGVLQAELILPDGKDVGPHLFFIQLRNIGISLWLFVCMY
jgi:alkylation response protein AidB-like acyl-CoA dehydrogenase